MSISGFPSLFAALAPPRADSAGAAPLPDEVPPRSASFLSASPLLAALSAPDLAAEWEERASYYPALLPDQIASARLFVTALRDRAVEGLRDTTDEAEFNTVALLAFTRLKAFWFELNGRIGHHLETEIQDDSILLRASLAASVLERMEPFLPERSVRKVDAFLAAVAADDDAGEVGFGGAHPNVLLPGPALVREKISNLLGTIGDLSKRVVSQEAELIELRAGSAALEKAVGEAGATPRAVAARLHQLTATVTALEAQAGMEEVYREVLSQALGTTDPLEVVKQVRVLRAEAKAHQSEASRLSVEQKRIGQVFGEELTPRDALDRMRDAERAVAIVREESAQILSRLSQQADRTAAANAERDRLLVLIGADDMTAAESALQTLRTNAAAYADIAVLLGGVDALGS